MKSLLPLHPALQVALDVIRAEGQSELADAMQAGMLGAMARPGTLTESIFKLCISLIQAGIYHYEAAPQMLHVPWHVLSRLIMEGESARAHEDPLFRPVRELKINEVTIHTPLGPITFRGRP